MEPRSFLRSTFAIFLTVSGENVNEVLDGERTEQANLHQTDLLALGVEVVDDSPRGRRRRNPCRRRRGRRLRRHIVEQTVIAPSLALILAHVLLDDSAGSAS